MRNWVRLVTGLVLVGASFAVLGIALQHLIETGSCSTNPVDNLPDCPKDTVWWILSIFGAVLTFLVGLGIFGSRRSRGGVSGSSASTAPAPARAVSSYAPKPPPLPTTWPVGGDAGADAEAEEDPLDRLEKLGELRDAGVLSDSEFELQKAKLLADI